MLILPWMGATVFSSHSENFKCRGIVLGALFELIKACHVDKETGRWLTRQRSGILEMAIEFSIHEGSFLIGLAKGHLCVYDSQWRLG